MSAFPASEASNEWQGVGADVRFTPLPPGSTMYLKMWTRQRCVECGTLYRYLARKAVPASFASAAATQADVEEFYSEFEKSGRFCPCPRCGLVQPDMVAKMQDSDYGVAMVFVGLVLGVNFVLALLNLFGPMAHLVIGAGLVGLALLFMLNGTLTNHNRSRAANGELMERELRKGRAEVLEEGAGAVTVVYPSTWPLKVVGFLVVIGAVAVPVLPLTAVPGLWAWAALAASFVLFVLGTRILSASLKGVRDAGADVGLDEVTSEVRLDDRIPQDFQDYVTKAGEYKSDWVAR